MIERMKVERADSQKNVVGGLCANNECKYSRTGTSKGEDIEGEKNECEAEPARTSVKNESISNKSNRKGMMIDRRDVKKMENRE